MKINVLSTEISNMIAAGEVVERPASVIKELTENSIDAGATSITVEIKKGGVLYMRVTDNGCGIARDEVETAFKRHATSKIKTASDLDSIGTLGFRGEALASIAAVSKVEIFTKTAESELGSCVTIEGGEVTGNDEAGCPNGTTMIIRNLFFNTPARMKFLKSDSAETSYVTDVMNKLALSHPEIAFKYINGDKTVLSSPGDGNLLNAIYSVFGKEYADNMKEVSYSEDGFSVHGYVGNASISRKDRRHQFFFVNSRNIMSKIMSSAVSEAFKTSVMVGHYPVCVLKADTDPRNVDVNVHPAKIEVRFWDEKKVYSNVYWAVRNALTEEKYVPEVKTASQTFENTVKNAPVYDKTENIQLNLLKDAYVESAPIVKKEEKPQPKKEIAEDKIIPQKTDDGLYRFSHIAPPAVNEVTSKKPQRFENMTPVTDEEIAKMNAPKAPVPVEGVDFKFVGQVFGTYFILQKDNEMYIIDQHAAHERICFEELLDAFRAGETESQLMLLPVTLTLTASEMTLAEENADFFEQIGFEIEPFGKNTAIVRATPGTMEEHEIKDVISDILSLAGANRHNMVRGVYEEALHMIACKKALKGNTVLSDTELKVLGAKVLALGDGINTCPHGRPIMVKMTRYSLERQFKRE